MPKLSAHVRTEPEVAAVVGPRIRAIVEERLDLVGRRKRIQARIDKLDAPLMAAVEKYGGKIAVEEWTATKVCGEQRTISRELLLKLGVKPTTIAKATVVKDKRPFVLITPKKAAEAKADGD